MMIKRAKSRGRIPIAGLVPVLVLLVAWPAGAGSPVGRDEAPWWRDGEEFGGVVDPASVFFDSPKYRELVELPGRQFEKFLDEVYTLHHDVPIGDGRTVHVIEYFSLQSWLRRPHRAVLFLTGPETSGEMWNFPAPEYNGVEMAVERGMFAFAVDFVGVGSSYKPEDGSVVFYQTNVEPMRKVLKYIRFFRAVPKVDLVGEATGGMVAVELGADKGRVRSCVMSTMLYQDLILEYLVSPEFAAFLSSFPDGYMYNPPEFYERVVERVANDEVRQYVFETQPGYYPTGPFWALFDGPPYFDPSPARVPGLVLAGEFDYVAGPDDPYYLAADYGTDGAQLIIIEGGGHLPRLEEPEIAMTYWREVFNFIDP